MSTLDLLPPGSPDNPHSAHLTPSPAPTAPNFGFLYRPVGLSQREEDALRIHILLLFYDDHALLWSSLEQHFHGLDERRLNAAIAYLEEVDAVQVEPAGAVNPWEPDDALVRLIPHEPSPPAFPAAAASSNTSTPVSADPESTLVSDRTLPLPWPGSHVYSPVIPATPAPPAFGFPVLLSETDYHAEQASEWPFPGSVSAGAAAAAAAAFGIGSSGRSGGGGGGGAGRRRSGAASRGTIPGLAITQINTTSATDQGGSYTPRAGSSGTPKTPTTTTHNPSTGIGISTFPSFDLLRLQSTTTVTPPSSDRWMSEENSPWLSPAADDHEAGSDAGERAWMSKRLGLAMSGVDYLDLDKVRDQARGEGVAEEAGEHEAAAASKTPAPPTQPYKAPMSYEMDDTLDIVQRAMTMTAKPPPPPPSSSSRDSSKKGRERTGLGVSFAHTDEINEFHPRSDERDYTTAWDDHQEDQEGAEEEAEAGHAKTPIPNPASGWMRRLERAYSYG
ncbi:hypothetical protein QFC21_004679 [Naganishia friedmannii]|uniref:Uncharacterized protein n=1 Tax=Naganishia friedmannii TaxID=89922 RepID=A0ACC2VEA9_9TREE|nr:hypothetical protein QFC21_004679 [Naganishia friedmannii]